MAAGKTYDVMINAPAAVGTAIPVYDRELSLSSNAVSRDAGMLAYIAINGSTLPTTDPALAPAVARNDSYPSLVAGQTLVVSDPSKGLIANDTNVYGVTLVGTVTGLTLNTNGTFSYTGPPVTFTYCANGTVTGTTCSSGVTATVSMAPAPVEGAGGITVSNITYTSNLATYLKIPTPGILLVDQDAAGYPLTVAKSSVTPGSGLTLSVDSHGAFTASVPGPGTYTFTYKAQNSQGTQSTSSATVTLIFPKGSGLSVSVVDGQTKAVLPGQDYRWIIEEDRTFYVDPKCTTNPPPSGCPGASSGIVPTFGVNFHTSNMPFVAQGCTGPQSCEAGQTVLGNPVVCDVGDGACRPDTTGNGQTPILRR